MKQYRQFTIPLSWTVKHGNMNPRFWREVMLIADELQISKNNKKLIGVIIYVLKRKTKSNRGIKGKTNI